MEASRRRSSLIGSVRSQFSHFLRRDSNPERLQSAYPKPLDGMHPDYPFENLVFQGGGARGVVYVGAAQALDELGILPYVKRAAASSVGCIAALVICLGLDSKQIVEEMNNLDTSKFFDNKRGKLPVIGKYYLAKNAFKRLGMHKAAFVTEYIGDLLEKYAGNRDLTFKELYDRFGRELCVTVSNLSRHELELCHVVTTPDVPIRRAIRASMSLPILWEPIELKNNRGEKFVDGGLFMNFPLKAVSTLILFVSQNLILMAVYHVTICSLTGGFSRLSLIVISSRESPTKILICTKIVMCRPMSFSETIMIS